jgi:hypothetical protein
MYQCRPEITEIATTGEGKDESAWEASVSVI